MAIAGRMKYIPFHIALLPLFFILNVVNEYYGLLITAFALKYLGYYILLAAALFLSGKLLFKSNSTSALWGTILLTVFFFWGAFHDYIKGLGLHRFLTSYSFLLPLLCIFIVSIFILIRKIKEVHRFAFFLNLLFVLFVFIELVQIAGKAFSSTDVNDLSAQNPPLPIKEQFIADSLKPDIFFIVFDEYASSLSLKKYLDFDNAPLDSVMKANGFYIAANSKSNYNVTPLSVSSTFDLQYFYKTFEKKELIARDFQKALATMKKSFIHHFLKTQGYEVLNFALDAENGIAPGKFSAVAHKKIFYTQTLLGRIERDILWNFSTLLNAPGDTEERKIKIADEIKDYKLRNLKNFDGLINELKANAILPKFVYMHILIPHEPFCLDRDGNPVVEPVSKLNSPQRYIEQVLYTNKLIEQIVMASKLPVSRPRVIIVEGDHGYRGYIPKNSTREVQFMNLNTFYFSDGDYTLLYDSISPVNTFRVVLNKYFKQELPMLKDSTVFVIN